MYLADSCIKQVGFITPEISAYIETLAKEKYQTLINCDLSSRWRLVDTKDRDFDLQNLQPDQFP